MLASKTDFVAPIEGPGRPIIWKVVPTTDSNECWGSNTAKHVSRLTARHSRTANDSQGSTGTYSSDMDQTKKR